MRHLRPALTILLALTVLTGLLYPLLVTAIASVVFPTQAGGSLIVKGGHVAGSRLIGQYFGSPKYFWGRPSATAPFANNAMASTGSNAGPLNPTLVSTVQERIGRLHQFDANNVKPIPVDLVTTSASGLDPDISIAAALFQVSRIATIRKLDEPTLTALIAAHAKRPLLGFLGEPRINVLELNLALDDLN